MREIYSDLSRNEQGTVEHIGSTIGKEAVGTLLSALEQDGQQAAIAQFIQHEFSTGR